MADEDELMRHVSSGLAGWISFQHAAGRRKLNLEHYLYPPIFEIALGQKWTVIPQFPIPTNGKNPRTFDFLFRRNRTIRKVRRTGLAAVEVKRVRRGTHTQFWKDAEKLQSVIAANLELRRDYGELTRYLLLIGSEVDITEYFNSERKGALQFKKKFGEVDVNAILNAQKNDRGWRRKGPLLPDDRYKQGRQTVLVFKVDK
jgi:hypothetical protein